MAPLTVTEELTKALNTAGAVAALAVREAALERARELCEKYQPGVTHPDAFVSLLIAALSAAPRASGPAPDSAASFRVIPAAQITKWLERK